MALHDNEMRTVYADTLLSFIKENPNVVCLEADLGKASGTYPKINDAYPDNYIDVGIAEANMMGISAGLASEGKIPFAATFSAFASRRAYDQTTISIAYSKKNVKVIGTAPGITQTVNGGTHMCLQDLAIMRAIPGMNVYSPADAYELVAVMKYMVKEDQPTYMQLIREKVSPVFDDNCTFDPHQAKILSTGTDVTIATTGFTTHIAVNAVKKLKEAGVSAEHIHYPSVKPFDAKTLIESAKKTKCVVTVENQTIIGGFGSACCEVLSENNPVILKRLGANDRFGEVGDLAYLIKLIGIGEDDIVNACREIIKQKK